MALTSQTDGRHVLPCGRDIEDLWRRLPAAADPPADTHEAGCPHCRTARASLLALADATRAVFDDRSLVPSPALRDRIMSAVRAEVRRGQRLPLPSGALGPVDVSEQAVATVLRFAADTIDGVRARRCRLRRIDGDEHPQGSVLVEMSVALRYRADTGIDLVAAVRERVVAAAQAHVGLEVTRVDVEVEDVYLDRG